jgi:hypothetical protein
MMVRRSGDARCAAPAAHDGEDALDQVFAALADPVRRSILSRLDGQELLVSQIAQHFDISLQAVSKHIQVLALRRRGLAQPLQQSLRNETNAERPVQCDNARHFSHCQASAIE